MTSPGAKESAEPSGEVNVYSAWTKKEAGSAGEFMAVPWGREEEGSEDESESVVLLRSRVEWTHRDEYHRLPFFLLPPSPFLSCSPR